VKRYRRFGRDDKKLPLFLLGISNDKKNARKAV
jgi:hypothetical protein